MSKYKHTTRQFKRFLIIGSIGTTINYSIYYILIDALEYPYIPSFVIGYLSGLLFGYFYNRKWTFASKEGKKVYEFAKYLSVYMASLVLSSFFLDFLVKYFEIHPALAGVFAIGLSTVTNFLGSKFLVFRRISDCY